MTRVGFLLNFPVEYKGGINYFKNLFFAINKHFSSSVQIVLFIPTSCPSEIAKVFEPFALIIKTSLIERKSLPWLLSSLGNRVLNFDFLTYLFFRKHKIDVVSYCFSYIHVGKSVKSINWIPDFQSLHFPHFWTEKQLKEERRLLDVCVKNSDLVLFSSYSAQEDFKQILPEFVAKARVLHFVSQPDLLNVNVDFDVVKYADRSFYYLPNQFWEHKNHLTVFKSVKILVDKGLDILLITSGLMEDFRNNNAHINELLRFVEENKLGNNIKFLGLIPYSDVFGLIRNSIAVINPSYFEGWSSTVEEAKSIGKTVLLSDIPVHREQAPDKAFYFKPNDEYAIADLLESLQTQVIIPTENSILMRDLENRTKAFAMVYANILTELVNHEPY
jgi:glycosyltransferase involved in cell wall biosynthesis